MLRERYTLALLSAFLLVPVAAAADAPRKPAAEETAKWKTEIARLLKQLPDGYPRLDGKEVEAPAAAVELRALDDPAIVPAIAALLATERRTEARVLLVEIAAKFKTDESLALVVKVAITDGDKFVRKAALATWKDYQRPEQILALLPPYIESEKLRYVALDALDKSGIQISPGQPPDKVLVKTLIKHLYRKVEQRVVVGSYESGAYGKQGRGFYGRPRESLVVIENTVPDVVLLERLKCLTSQNFGYDQKKWFSWINNDKR